MYTVTRIIYINDVCSVNLKFSDFIKILLLTFFICETLYVILFQ